jgi:PIN domain nuclease of toxin-antitoxin system
VQPPLLLDTHVWLWWLLRQRELDDRERDALDALCAAGTPPALSAISLWEAQMLAARGRLTLDIPLARWLPTAAAPESVVVVPLDVAVVLALDGLPGTFHGDPADRIIAATARAHDLPLATQDRKLRRSRTVRIWKP